MATHTGYPLFMGCRVLRVLRPGAGKPDRVQRQRRTVLTHATESHPGGHITHRIHGNSHTDVQGSGPAVEPSCCVHLPDNGSILRIPEINPGKL